MSSTETASAHTYPHQRSEEVSADMLRQDFEENRDQYHPGLHNDIENVLDTNGERKNNEPQSATQVGEVVSRLTETDLSGWTSEEELSDVIGSMKTENGELREGAGKVVLGNVKRSLGDSNSNRRQFYSALAEHPEVVIGMIEEASHPDATDWDMAAARIATQKSSEQLLAWRESQAMKFDPFGDGSSRQELSPDQEAEAAHKEAVAAKLSEVLTILPEADENFARDEARGTTSELFSRYAARESEGLSMAQAKTFDGMLGSYAKSLGETTSTEVIQEVTGKYEASSIQMKRMYDSSSQDPTKIAQLHDKFSELQDKPDGQPNAKMKQLAELTFCGVGESADAFVDARNMIESFDKGGASTARTLDFLGDSRSTELLSTLKSQVSAEQYDTGVNMLSRLARHDITEHLDQYLDKTQEASRQKMINAIVSSPQTYEAFIDGVDQNVDAVAESGFPVRITADRVYDRFSNYFINRGVDDDRAYIESELAYQKHVGGVLQPLESVNPNLARKLVGRGEADRIPAEEIAAIGESVKGVVDDHPHLTDRLEERLFGVSEPSEVRIVLEATRATASMDDIFTLLKERKMSGYDDDNFRREFIQQATNLSETPTAETIQKRANSIRQAKGLLLDARVSSYQELFSAVNLRGEAAPVLLEQLESQQVQAGLDDPKMNKAINGAVSVLGQYAEKVSIAESMNVVSSVEDYETRWLKDMIYDEGRLRGEAGFTNASLDTYRGVFVEAMARKDKDGNYYDGSESIYQAVTETFYRQYPGDSLNEADLEWYRGSELPIAGYTAIAEWRSAAVEAGVADTPRAVSEWIYKDPEQVAKISTLNTENYLSRHVYHEDPTQVGGAIESAKSELESRRDVFRVTINISSEALAGVIDSGGMINSFFDRNIDLDRSDRGDYDLVRSGVEVALGLRSMDDETPHPIYGSCMFVDQEVPVGAVGYGDILLTFKESPELASRTTYTPEDSFHGAQRLTAEDAKVLRLAKDAKGIGHSRTRDYVEAQIQGGVSLSEVDAIYVNSQEQKEFIAAKLPQEYIDRIVLRSQE